MKSHALKHTLAMILSLVLLAGVLTACQSSTPSSTVTSAPDTSSPETSDATASGAAVEDYMSGPATQLRLVLYGDMSPRREEYFKKDFHDKVLEELNIDLSVEMLAWGSEDTIATMLASGEDFAFYNILSSQTWVSKGYLAEIDEGQINALMPEFLEMRGPNNGFECSTYQGGIYMIPIGNKPYSGRMQSFEVRNDILNEVGFDAKDITTYDQLLDAMDAVKVEYPNLRLIQSVTFLTNALSAEISDTEYLRSPAKAPTFATYDMMEDGDKVYSYYESDYFAKVCEIASDWQTKGYINEDLLTNPTQGLADWNAGNCLMLYGTPGALIDQALSSVAPDADLQLIHIGDAIMYKDRDYDWGISISAVGQEKVPAWLRLFNWIYASQENYDFCVYGVEGQDYEINDDGSINPLTTDSFWDAWFLEASEYVHYDPKFSEEVVNEYIHYDDGSVLAKYVGFNFDSSSVSAELAALTAIYDEFLNPMSCGQLDYASNIDDVISKMKAAGIDDYIAEYQRQYSEWVAAQ